MAVRGIPMDGWVECDNAVSEGVETTFSVPSGFTTYATERCDAVAAVRTAYGSLCRKCYARSAGHDVLEVYT